jgi:hypothetical protein
MGRGDGVGLTRRRRDASEACETLIQTQVIRHQIRTEYKVQFPYLYTSRPRAVALAPYHHPPLYYVKPDDPDLPAFYFDPVLKRRPQSRSSPRDEAGGGFLSNFEPIHAFRGRRDSARPERPRNRNRDHPRPRLMDTTPDDVASMA